jgi:ribosomal-protein-alanine N-acetyltransferase
MMRIYLRAFELEDYKLINQWRSDPEITALLSGNVMFVSSEREKKWVEDKIFEDSTSLYLGICLKESNELIGYLSVTSIDYRNRKAEWAGLIIGRKDLMRHGYANEAVRLMLEHLFFQLGLGRVYAHALEEHVNSIRMMMKAGFKKEGVLRNNVFKDNRFHNSVFMSLLKEEFDTLLEEEKVRS